MHWQVLVSNELVQTWIVSPLNSVIVCFSRHATFFVGYTGGNDIKALIRWAVTALFKNKGLVNKIKSAMESLTEALRDWTDCRKKYGKKVGKPDDDDSSPLEARSITAMRRAQTTITEAKWLTILREPGEDCEKGAALQIVLDEAMDTKRVDGSDIKACLYEEVMRIISL